MAFLLRIEGITQPYSPGTIRRARKIETVTNVKPAESIQAISDNRSHIITNPYDQHSAPQGRSRQPALKARSIMSAPVITAAPVDSLQQVLKLFRNHRFRHIPVVSGNSLIVGIISDRDLLGVPDPNNKLVSDIMHTSVLVADPETPLYEIARVLFEERIGCLPLIEDDLLVGIVTRSDLLRAVMTRAPLELWT